MLGVDVIFNLLYYVLMALQHNFIVNIYFLKTKSKNYVYEFS
jgi:hypothetical protein